MGEYQGQGGLLYQRSWQRIWWRCIGSREPARDIASPKDTVWQRQFEDSFAYEGTPGQTESIVQIKRDMESGKIMDRLLLGDMGYGKTEVAMRACFKAVMDSSRWRCWCRRRFSPGSTMRPLKGGLPASPCASACFPAIQKSGGHHRAVNEGRIDIIIGTHKLALKQIHYKDLGAAVVVDEGSSGSAFPIRSASRI